MGEAAKVLRQAAEDVCHICHRPYSEWAAWYCSASHIPDAELRERAALLRAAETAEGE